MKCCTCRMCRRSIRLMIERYYQRRPVWMDLWTIRDAAGLGWVDDGLYATVVRRMERTGQLIKSHEPGDPSPTYLSARAMVNPRALAERGQG